MHSNYVYTHKSSSRDSSDDDTTSESEEDISETEGYDDSESVTSKSEHASEDMTEERKEVTFNNETQILKFDTTAAVDKVNIDNAEVSEILSCPQKGQTTRASTYLIQDWGMTSPEIYLWDLHRVRRMLNQ